MLINISRVAAFSLCFFLLSACDTGPKSASGFRLPDGDAEKGQALFVQLRCHVCHKVSGVELEAPFQSGPVMITLGGPVANVKTYGELVSSIINPSHKLISNYPEDEVSTDGESMMRAYNDYLTVQQLIDLVAFLHLQYGVAIPEYSYYVYRY